MSRSLYQSIDSQMNKHIIETSKNTKRGIKRHYQISQNNRVNKEFLKRYHFKKPIATATLRGKEFLRLLNH